MKLLLGDCLDRLKDLPDNSVDSIVTDPPYGLSFMGKKWDYDVPSEDVWRECLRVLKPGGHLLAFAGTRTQHRMAVRIEDAGFEIRDMIAWIYGSGFPKSLNIGKAINKIDGVEFDEVPANGVGFMNAEGEGGYNVTKNQLIQKGESSERAKQWEGWGTALKPALEPITVARKPLIGTVAENVLTHGTGGLNIDGCRVEAQAKDDYGRSAANSKGTINAHEGFEGKSFKIGERNGDYVSQLGRFPANLIHDGSEEVVGLFPTTGKGNGRVVATTRARFAGWREMEGRDDRPAEKEKIDNYGDGGSAARFFYCAKASKKDRDEGLEGFEARDNLKWASGDVGIGAFYPDGTPRPQKDTKQKNFHPTVKPTDLMRYLCRLVTPPGGTVLDPFTGSGSTGKAALMEGFDFIGIERDYEYYQIALARINAVEPRLFAA